MDLIQQLVKRGVLEKKEATSLQFEIKSSGKKPEEILLEKGVVTEEFLFGLKSKNLNIPLRRVEEGGVPLKVLEQIPEESARYYQIIPLARKDKVLEVGMVYPEDLAAKEALKFLARHGKFDYKVFLITKSNFENLLKEYKTLRREVGKALEEFEVEFEPERIEKWPKTVAEFEKMAEEKPISKVVDVVLRHAVEGESSDIHIEPQKTKARVRFRVDGVLHSSISLPLGVLPSVVARIKILSNLRIDETRIPQDGRFSKEISGKAIDFRVSTFPTSLGEKVAIRILDPKEGLKDFRELGLERRNFEVVQEAVRRPLGIILATGPTGCGKTTTLYAILNLLNKERVNIVTLEDPVEYFIEGINQSQVRPEIDFDFASGLRQIVRQDPDIIMVGEIRDEETADLATHAALTGHLVLSTLHTSNAPGAIPRLIDLGVRSFLIPPTLSIVIAQRLVRKICPHCKKRIRAKGKIRLLILKEVESLPQRIKKEFIKKIKTPYIYRAEGCKKCKFKGLLGRTGIFEVLKMTDSLAEIISKEPSELKIRKEAENQGMITMRQDGILKVLEGITSIEEVIRVIGEE